jgi:hypothetical protein
VLAQKQGKEDDKRTQEVENRKHGHVKDQAPENPEKTKRIEELKKKEKEQ